ncbi:MAG: proton-conducting transporter membrane subunit [Verrucomicrobiales bacterium]
MGTLDANEAVASVSYRLNEFFAIYPITPSSPMAEFADEWSAAGRKNIWNVVPSVVEMQSEGGAAGALHGALMAGSLCASFTASQGLLLMIPNMYKIAGELIPFCLHVTARALATHALSIFGDHSDVMSCRQTGFAMLCGNSVQEAQDLAVISQMATLRSRVPFLHFFDGFRTSHEVSKIALLSDDDLRVLMDDQAIAANRARALTPDRPVVRGTAQNPDAFFQAREAGNQFTDAVPGIVVAAMQAFAERTGRGYKPFDYEGSEDAEDVVVIMGSGAEAVAETVEWLNRNGRKTGVVKVRLYRPFSVEHFAAVLRKSVKRIAVLDRTKEPGALGVPLYLDVVAALRQAERLGLMKNTSAITVTGGRYGLGSKEFTPAMVKAVFDDLAGPLPKPEFTVGINDDVTGLSLAYDPDFEVIGSEVKQSIFFGLGSDGTVGANKNSIKIIGESTDNFAQGYFVIAYSSVSHMGFVLLGLASGNRWGTGGAVLQMISHGLIAGLLFGLAGRVVYDRVHVREFEALEKENLWSRLRWGAVAFIVASAASMGLPGFSGFAAELSVLLGAWSAFPWLVAPVVLGVVVTGAFTLRAIQKGFLPQRESRATTATRPLPPLTWPEISATVLLLAASLAIGLYPAPWWAWVLDGLHYSLAP